MPTNPVTARVSATFGNGKRGDTRVFLASFYTYGLFKLFKYPYILLIHTHARTHAQPPPPRGTRRRSAGNPIPPQKNFMLKKVALAD